MSWLPGKYFCTKAIWNERGYILCYFDTSFYFIALRIHNNMHHTLVNCVYCAVLFYVETLTVTIACRQCAQYLMYLDIYNTSFIYTSCHNVFYIHQLSTFKLLFPHLQNTCSLPFTFTDALKCHTNLHFCSIVWTVRLACYCRY